MNLSKKLLLAGLVITFAGSPLKAMEGTEGTVEAPTIETVIEQASDAVDKIANNAADTAEKGIGLVTEKVSTWLEAISSNKGTSAIIAGAVVVAAYAGYRGYKYLKKKSEDKENQTSVWDDAKKISC